MTSVLFSSCTYPINYVIIFTMQKVKLILGGRKTAFFFKESGYGIEKVLCSLWLQ